MLALVRSAIPPVHPAGRPFIAGGLAIAAVGRNYRWLRRTGLLAAGACAAFFRHPPRVPPTAPGAVVAPADGVVCVIDSAAPPTELGMGDTPLPRISIFLSLLPAKGLNVYDIMRSEKLVLTKAALAAIEERFS